MKPVLLESGFEYDGRFYRRRTNDVIWFFDWQRPYDGGGQVCVQPQLCVGSEVWMAKVGVSLEVRPGATQVEIPLADLVNGPNSKGFPIPADAWQDSADLIASYWRSHGLPFLSTVQITSDLVAAIERQPSLSPKIGERKIWEAKVWRGEIDPRLEPYAPQPRDDNRVWSRDELMRIRQESKEL